MGSIKAKEEVDLIMKTVHLDKNEYIDYTEFVAAQLYFKNFYQKTTWKNRFDYPGMIAIPFLYP